MVGGNNTGTAHGTPVLAGGGQAGPLLCIALEVTGVLAFALTCQESRDRGTDNQEKKHVIDSRGEAANKLSTTFSYSKGKGEYNAVNLMINTYSTSTEITVLFPGSL